MANEFKAKHGLIVNGAATINSNASVGGFVLIGEIENNLVDDLQLEQSASIPQLKSEYIDLSTTATVTGARARLWFNTTDDTLVIQQNNSVVQEIGQKLFAPLCVNTTGSTISTGTLVMITGVSNGKMTIAPADTSGSTNANYIIGVAAHNIANNATDGKIVTSGIISGINTSSFGIGQNNDQPGGILYPNSAAAGSWTLSEPTGASIKSIVAIVLKLGTTDGIIFIRDAGNSPNTEFPISIASASQGEILEYNDTTEQWENIYPRLGVDTQRCGFVNHTTSGIFFNSTASPVTNQGTEVPAYGFQIYDTGSGWTYYINGKRVTVTGNKTVSLGSPPANDVHYVFISNNLEGNLSTSTSVWNLTDPNTIPVGIVRFHASMTPNHWLADERHTILIDRRLHRYLHTNFGTKVTSAGELTGYTLRTATDAGNTFGIGASSLSDEDLIVSLGALTDTNGTTANYIIFYRVASTSWEWKSSLMPYSYATGSYIQWDNNGTLTTGQASRYYNTYVLFTHYIGAARFFIVSGRSEFTSVSNAQAEDPSEFIWTDISIAEYAVVYQLTWGTSNSYNNLGKCRLEIAPKRINVSTATSAAVTTANHSELSGLQGGSVNEYYHFNATQHSTLTSIADNTAPLSINNITLTENGGGIVFKSPNGTSYELTVQDDGTMIVSSV